jgi:hypothetical protein
MRRRPRTAEQIKARAFAARTYKRLASGEEPGIPLEPNTFAEAMQLPDKARWLEAVQSELQSLQTNNTFKEIAEGEVPKGKKVLGACWVFSKKPLDNSELKYKARLVIKGYEQRFGIHYTETYAPVVNLRTVRTLLALAAYLDMEVHQMDVTTAFLNAELPEDEQIHMEVPAGYSTGASNTVALLLLKSLYGLK